MKYFKKSKRILSKSLVLSFVLLILSLGYSQLDILNRSLITVNLGSIYVKYLNEKAEIINFLRKNKIKTLSISMSPNNYVRLQKERSQMVNNFIFNGIQWPGQNNYYKSLINDGVNQTKSEIRLFGLNPDHFRDVNGHSFRIKFDGDKGYGNKKVNFLNPRSRDFITDPLMNIIYSKLYNGIAINYEPYRIILNKASYGVLLMEDFFDKYLIEENKKRESVIFEVVNDSIHFNYKGDNNSLDLLAFEIDQLYRVDYKSFIKKIDISKLKGVLKLGLLINDGHPFSDINLHWYYNPVTNLFEPIFREGFVKKIDGMDLDGIAKSNPIISSLYNDKIKQEIISELLAEVKIIESILNHDPVYNKFKKQMVGFSDQIYKRENIIKHNLEFLKNYDFEPEIEYNQKVEEIKFTKDTILKSDLVISPTQKLIIQPGVTLTLDNSYLEVYGGFEAIGTKKNPINILGKDDLGTIYFNTNEEIKIDNVNFINLSNKLSEFDQPASITFYESNSVEISNSLFTNNKSGDDFLNFFRCNNIFISNSKFEKILNDAIDSDFSSLSITDSNFNNIGNDAVDGSGSEINIANSYFSNVKDKAVSSGEKSIVHITDSSFISNEIGVVSKDASKLYISKTRLSDNKIDFSSFVKKKYFGPSETYFFDIQINNYLIEKNSKISGLDSIIYSTNVEAKLYGNIYGRASE